jgi:hypothetical protein
LVPRAIEGGTLEQGRWQRIPPWPALIVAVLLLAGAVFAGIRVADDDRPGEAVVSAAGSQSRTIDVTSTVTVPLPAQPSSTVATTTTRPKAAVDVLNAIGGSTTTTRRPASTTTTQPPAPTTTVPVSTTVAPTTTTTIARFTANLVNEYPQAVVLIVNGQQFPLEPAQKMDVDLAMSGRGDVIQARLAGDANCGSSDSGEIFRANTRYRIAIIVGEAKCTGSELTRPRLDITRL